MELEPWKEVEADSGAAGAVAAERETHAAAVGEVQQQDWWEC